MVPLKRQAVVLVKCTPLIVTTVPSEPLTGLNEVITGVEGKTTKLAVLVPVFPLAVTVSTPVLAPAGTTAVSILSLINVNADMVPLKRTAVVPVNRVPFKVTTVPAAPVVGENELINTEGGSTWKVPWLMPVFPFAVT